AEVKYRRSSGLSPELKVGGPSMLGIGCPDRHALPHITPTKHTDPDSCSLPRERVRSSAQGRRSPAFRRMSLHPSFADLHQCKPLEFTTYALASRLRASWMEARVTKVARVSARFSKSLARRRFRPNQEKVRSTTQRRGRTTKPFMSSFRLTNSMRSGGTFATAASTCHAL